MTNINIGPVCLVTGGAGYLGSAIVNRLLKLGYQVRSFDVKSCPVEHGQLTSFTGDIRQYDDIANACEGVNTVFHTAAIISLLGFCRSHVRHRVLDVNVGGSSQLIKAAKDKGVQRIVATSTNNVCFDHEMVMGDETIPLATRPIDLYTETKALAERTLLAADNGNTGLRVAALRPGGIWGLASDGEGMGSGGIMISSILKQIASGSFSFLIGDGTAETDNTHIDNLVDAQMLLAEHLITAPHTVGGEAYYVTDEEPMNAMEWFRPLTDGLDETFPTRRLPGKLMYSVAFIVEAISCLMNKEASLTRMQILKVIRSHSFKCDKARRDLGYAPKRKRTEGIEQLLPIAKQEIERLKAKRKK